MREKRPITRPELAALGSAIGWAIHGMTLRRHGETFASATRGTFPREPPNPAYRAHNLNVKFGVPRQPFQKAK